VYYVTSHPGQLSLAIPLWLGAMGTRIRLESLILVPILVFHRSGHGSQTMVYPRTGSTAYEREMSTRAYAPSVYDPPFP